MGDDEVVVLVICCVIAAARWWPWYSRALMPPELISPRSSRWVIVFMPLISVVALLVILQNWASHDVRDSAVYTLFYAAMGVAWVGLGTALFPVMGLFPVQDVVERRNHAAAWAVAGGILGLMLAFAGGNIGDGPGWWVVVFSAVLATGAWFALWIVAELISGITHAVTVERDVASGVRLGALLLAVGGVLGRSVAGDWHSVEHTLADFARVAWPTIGLVMLEGIVAFAGRPRVHHPRPSAAVFGVFPGLVYVTVAMLWVVALGWWL